MSNTPLVENISDTARWVAYYRAKENARQDALFRDPFASRLAGEKGEEIGKSMKYGKSTEWYLIIRTKVLDETILELIKTGQIDSVLNLAAGLDTRPYRLELPKEFPWFEADLPGILEYKEKILAADLPRCKLERFRCDLSLPEKRKELFQSIDARAKKCLVITEGLLIYLTKPLVDDLANDLCDHTHFRFWLFDFTSELGLKMVEKRWNKELEKGNSRMQFAPPGGPSYFKNFGWSISRLAWASDESLRLGRDLPFGWIFKLITPFIPAERKKAFQHSSGFALLHSDSPVL